MRRSASSLVTVAAVLALLAAAQSATLVGAVAAAKGTFAAFNPATFTVQDLAPATVSIQLLEQPDATTTASIFLEADGVLFDKCRLDFTNANWNQGQSVTIFPKAAFDATPGKQTSIFGAKLAWVNNPSGSHATTQSLTFTRDVQTGRLCTANGDPHYTSFDKKTFDFFLDVTSGVYDMLVSDTLRIQTTHGKWSGNNHNAVSVAIAMAYGGTVYIADACKAGNDRIALISPKGDGVSAYIDKTNQNDLHFMFSDGANVKLTVQNNAAFGNYFDVTITVPACYKTRTSAMCGTYDDNPNNDFIKPDGSTAKDNMDFGNSWKTADTDNMFSQGMKAAFLAKMKSQPATVSCSLPTDFNSFGITPPPQGYTIVQATTTAYTATPYATTTQTTDPSRMDDAFLQYVKPLCQQFVNIDGITKIPQLPANLVQANIDNCVKDCQLGGIIDPVDTYRVAVLRAAHQVAEGAMANFKICEITGRPRPRTASELNDFAKSIGFGSFQCPGSDATLGDDDEYTPLDATKACNGHGTCQTFGCMCTAGWGGLDCMTDMKAKAAGIPPRPTGGVATTTTTTTPITYNTGTTTTTYNTGTTTNTQYPTRRRRR